MHNLAIALKRKGFEVTGSDDEIFDPSRSRLEKEGLLPDKMGWLRERITSDLDAVVLGMHAREDNPELDEAKKLGIRVFSYPEYIYEQTKDKKRVVIGGSHGKTTITAILLHVLKKLGLNSDYMVGAQLEGMDCMVRLSDDTGMAVLEGDEYLSSPIDRRPKFHLYRPDIALLTGIAWDHINVFPTFNSYVEQFQGFVDVIESGGSLVYFAEDPELRKLAGRRHDLNLIPYEALPSKVESGKTVILQGGKKYETPLFGDHNMANLGGAVKVGSCLGIREEDFLSTLSDFPGAAKRLEKVAETQYSVFYKDFAHAPSKLKATTAALKNQYPERKLVACMELHTFSSLNKGFLPQYRGSMDSADRAFVYYSPEVVARKKLESISPLEVAESFGNERVEVFTDSNELLRRLEKINWRGNNLLMMSSGNFDGIDFERLGRELFT